MSEEIYFIDKSFDYNNIQNYHMSLQVFLRGFSFTVLDRNINKYLAIGHYSFEKVTSFRGCIGQIDEIISAEPLLQQNYQHIKLIFAASRFTFVPSSFYSKQDKENWFTFNHDKINSEELETNYIYGNSVYTIFGVPVTVNNFFKAKYPAIKIYHQSVPMIEELMLKSKIEDQGTKVYLQIFATFFDFILISDGNLKLYNSFNYQSINDFNYFFLNAFDKLKLSPLETPVFLCGIVPSDNQVLASIRAYIKKTGYFEKPAHFEYAYGFNNFPAYYFTNIINLYQCG